jgi:hypothetical protein
MRLYFRHIRFVPTYITLICNSVTTFLIRSHLRMQHIWSICVLLEPRMWIGLVYYFGIFNYRIIDAV